MYRVLIAEDEQIEREMLMQIVSAHFPTIDQIIPAENGQQAVDLFDQYQPDLILMDINMPLKSGMEALREIRQIAKKAFVCIILTSYNDFSYAQDGIRLHVDDYILKPAEDAQIIASISAGIEKLQQEWNMHASIRELLRQNEDVSSLLESECVFAIINQKEEKVIARYFQMARMSARYAFCLVVEVEEDNILVAQIRGIIEERMDLEQFSDCDITMADLTIIRRTLVSTLTGVYHHRVKYPSIKYKHADGKTTGENE